MCGNWHPPRADLESSTAIASAAPRAFERVQEIHDTLLRELIGRYNGYEINTGARRGGAVELDGGERGRGCRRALTVAAPTPRVLCCRG